MKKRKLNYKYPRAGNAKFLPLIFFVMKTILDFFNNLAQSKISLAILGVLVVIAGLLATMVHSQQQEAIGRVKEAECRRRLKQVPNSGTGLFGNKLLPHESEWYAPGELVNIYGFDPPRERWPGAFFTELSRDGGYGRFSITARVQSVNGESVVVASDCFPQPFEVSVDHLYDMVIAPYRN